MRQTLSENRCLTDPISPGMNTVEALTRWLHLHGRWSALPCFDQELFLTWPNDFSCDPVYYNCFLRDTLLYFLSQANLSCYI